MGGKGSIEEQNQKMEKSSTKLFVLLLNLSSLRSLASVKRAIDIQRVEGRHFSYSAFSGGDISQTWIRMEQHRSGYTAKEERKYFWGRNGASEFGVCWVAVVFCRNIDGCRR